MNEIMFDDRPPAWKRAGVVWMAISLNFSLWGAFFWAVDTFA